MYYNDIRDSGMDSFINSLPNYGSGDKHEIYMINTIWEDGNKCTKNQVKKIKEKGWTPYYYDGEWHEYEGGEEDSIHDIKFEDSVKSIYTISGQRFDKPQKGVNIINGKKYVIK